MGTFGGKQPGAGRPRKDEKFSVPIAAAEQRIVDKLPRLIDKMFHLAEGVLVQETDKEGNKFVYTEPPDGKALSYLIDRIMGKSVTRIDEARLAIEREKWELEREAIESAKQRAETVDGTGEDQQGQGGEASEDNSERFVDTDQNIEDGQAVSEQGAEQVRGADTEAAEDEAWSA